MSTTTGLCALGATLTEMGPAHPIFGATLNEGKTKRIIEKKDDPNKVILLAKDDITAGDGAKHDIIPDKRRDATDTTCNVFRLLRACHIPVAFEEQGGPDWFIAPKCQILPYEVVTRREAHGSFLKRNPHLKKGHLFPKIVFELYLKTKDRRWQDYKLDCDDPYMIWDREIKRINLYNPAKPLAGQKPFLELCETDVFTQQREFDGTFFKDMEAMAKRTFLVLEKAWQIQGRKLVDMKVEFGVAPNGNLLLADVIDNDSWRVIENGEYIDKQVYRDGGDLSDVAKRYAQVAEITMQFKLPHQEIFIWTGSPSDDIQAFRGYKLPPSVKFSSIVYSAHKTPVTAIQKLHKAIQKTPDCVFIAYAGMSNGLGPILAGNCSVPVLTVPAMVDKFPDDIWSSLRAPSRVPVATILDPKNAMHHALINLAKTNPDVYATLRIDLEERQENIVIIS